MIWNRLLHRLTAVRASELFLLPFLIPVALATRVALRFLPVPNVLKIAARFGLRRRRDLGSLVATADLAAAVARRSGHCLLRSVLLFGLIDSRKVPVEFIMGVRRHQSNLEGHAWIELGGVALGEGRGMIEDFNVVFRTSHP